MKHAEEAIDVYLKEMTEEQRAYFDEWLQDELQDGRIPNKPDAFSLKILARGWVSGWERSRTALVRGVHSL